MISRNFSPNEERYRTLNTESSGIGEADLSSLRLSSAAVQQVSLEDVLAWATVPACVPDSLAELAISLGLTRVMSIDSTTPTRLPPIRTSLFGASRAASQISAETR